MTIREFLQFRQIAETRRIFFTYGISKGTVTVKAPADKLELIGY